MHWFYWQLYALYLPCGFHILLSLHTVQPNRIDVLKRRRAHVFAVNAHSECENTCLNVFVLSATHMAAGDRCIQHSIVYLRFGSGVFLLFFLSIKCIFCRWMAECQVNLRAIAHKLLGPITFLKSYFDPCCQCTLCASECFLHGFVLVVLMVFFLH